MNCSCSLTSGTQGCEHLHQESVSSDPGNVSGLVPGSWEWFYIFRWLEKNQRRNQNFVTSESDTKFKFQHPEIKFYWSTALLTALHVAHSICTTTAELRSCDRRQRLYGPMEPFLLSGPLQKECADPWFRVGRCHLCPRSSWGEWHVSLTFLEPLTAQWPCVGREEKSRFHHPSFYCWGSWGSAQSRETWPMLAANEWQHHTPSILSLSITAGRDWRDAGATAAYTQTSQVGQGITNKGIRLARSGGGLLLGPRTKATGAIRACSHPWTPGEALLPVLQSLIEPLRASSPICNLSLLLIWLWRVGEVSMRIKWVNCV